MLASQQSRQPCEHVHGTSEHRKQRVQCRNEVRDDGCDRYSDAVLKQTHRVFKRLDGRPKFRIIFSKVRNALFQTLGHSLDNCIDRSPQYLPFRQSQYRGKLFLDALERIEPLV